MDDQETPGNGIGASMARLGIDFGRRQIIAFFAAFVAGLVVAYVLPVFYTPVVGTAMDQIGQCTGCWRDTVNKFLMTGLTLAVSFTIGFMMTRKKQ